ncbi:hypothetical protein [Streptomyces sp. NBC_00019]|uniref:hypothetical protein n=1 Tax=Streptomyces sp. NBC_00019 TaxID=2975623 RepID=UPI003243DC10
MGSSRTPTPRQGKDHDPCADPEHAAALDDDHPDTNIASVEQSEPSSGIDMPIVEVERVTARWTVTRWSRTERLRFARLLFGNALREERE